jgi:hypothetical protein
MTGRQSASGTTTATPLPEDLDRAVRRWKLGHHCFHLYLVGMNTTLDAAHQALESSDWARLEQLLEDLYVLFDATTAAMKYTTGFRPATYQSVIRPSMSEPMVSPGFSGQLNRDHEVMLGSLMLLRNELRRRKSAGQIVDDVDRAWRRVMSALARNRSQHMKVCEKFVTGGTSLLAQYLKERSEYRKQDQHPAEERS